MLSLRKDKVRIRSAKRTKISRRRRTMAIGSFCDIAPGKRKAVTLKASAAARRLLRTRKALAVRVELRPSGGGKLVSKKVTLKR